MEMYTIEIAGTTIEVSKDEYHRLQNEFYPLWDPTGECDEEDWFFCGKFDFHCWMYERITGFGC